MHHNDLGLFCSGQYLPLQSTSFLASAQPTERVREFLVMREGSLGCRSLSWCGPMCGATWEMVESLLNSLLFAELTSQG